jgi:hypothetical protein
LNLFISEFELEWSELSGQQWRHLAFWDGEHDAAVATVRNNNDQFTSCKAVQFWGSSFVSQIHEFGKYSENV